MHVRILMLVAMEPVRQRRVLRIARRTVGRMLGRQAVPHVTAIIATVVTVPRHMPVKAAVR